MAGEKPEKENVLYAVVRVRGPVNMNKKIENTMKMLRLQRINHCVIIPKTPTYEGMLNKTRECITWGEINKETLKKIIHKRGSSGGRRIEQKKSAELAKKIVSEPKTDFKGHVFRLNPPSKGYKAIRRFYPKGALGYRGGKINELLKRMI